MPSSIVNVCAMFCEVTEQSSQPEQNLGVTVLHSKSGSVQGLPGRESGSFNCSGPDSDRLSSGWPPSLN